MKSKPVIIVQLVHIQGPLKGEIQEFSEVEISFGRHPSCHVHFPKDLAIVSRKHARIIREGNRFKLFDHSTNGTFVNGKKVHEAYLKDGDVLIFAEGGPKVSFLTRRATAETAVAPPFSEKVKISMPESPPVPSYHPEPSPPPEPGPAPPPQPCPAEDISIKRVQVPLVIQYGPTLRSFKELPVTIGKSPDCDFILDHPEIFDHHAQLFFSQDQYWVKDLTGRQLISINGEPVKIKAPLDPDNHLSLSPQGPTFRFLGGGRLAEIDEALQGEDLAGIVDEKEETPSKEKCPATESKGAGAILKKIFKR